MNDGKRQLQGSPSRDIFKRAHKEMARWLYASDIDMALVSKNPPGVVAFLDYKTPWDMVQFSEVILYNQLSCTAPVYIIQSPNPQTGPFTISLFSTGDHRPFPPRVELELTTECRSLKELEAWECKLRANYSATRRST